MFCIVPALVWKSKHVSGLQILHALFTSVWGMQGRHPEICTAPEDVEAFQMYQAPVAAVPNAAPHGTCSPESASS